MATFFLIIIYLAFISLGLPDSLLGSAWPVMRPDFNAPLETAGVLYMVIASATIVSSLLSGAVLRRFGTGQAALVSCLMTAAALAGFAASPSLLWLVLCAIPLGLGGGTIDAGLNHYVAAHYKAHHMNWLHCFWGVGATLGPMIMAQFISGPQQAWREGYWAVSGIQFSLVIILLFALPLWDRVAKMTESAASPSAEAGNPSPIDASLENQKPLQMKGLKLTLVSFLLYCGVEATAGLWGSSYLVNVKGLGAGTAAQWVSLYFGGITVGRFISGFVSFKMTNTSMIRIGQITALAGAVLLVLPLPAGFSLAGLIILGLGLAPIFPSLLHETPARFGQKHAQTIMGYQMAVAYTGSTLMPPLLGFLASKAGIGVFPVYIVVSAVLMYLLTERLNLSLTRKSSNLEG